MSRLWEASSDVEHGPSSSAVTDRGDAGLPGSGVDIRASDIGVVLALGDGSDLVLELSRDEARQLANELLDATRE